MEGREEWRGEKSGGERGVKGESEGRWKRKRRGRYVSPDLATDGLPKSPHVFSLFLYNAATSVMHCAQYKYAVLLLDQNMYYTTMWFRVT